MNGSIEKWDNLRWMICDALAQMFSRQAQAFNVAAEKYKDSEAGAHGE